MHAVTRGWLHRHLAGAVEAGGTGPGQRGRQREEILGHERQRDDPRRAADLVRRHDQKCAAPDGEHRAWPAVHRHLREAEQRLEDASRHADVPGTDDEALEAQRRGSLLVGRRRRRGDLDQHARARGRVQEADLAGQPCARHAIEHRHAAPGELRQRGADIVCLEAQVVQALATPGQEATDGCVRPQRLQQLELALSGGQQRGPHALVGDLGLAHEWQPEDATIERVRLFQVLHHDPDVMNPPHHLGILLDGGPTWPPNPPTLVAPRRSRRAPHYPAPPWGAPSWPPNPPTLVAPRRSRPAPRYPAPPWGARHGPQTPQLSSRPGAAGPLLVIPLLHGAPTWPHALDSRQDTLADEGGRAVGARVADPDPVVG